MNRIIVQIIALGLVASTGYALGLWLADNHGKHRQVVRATTRQVGVVFGASAGRKAEIADPQAPRPPNTLFIPEARVTVELRKSQTAAKSFEDLGTWLERDPNAALAWFAVVGWQTMGIDANALKSAMAKLSASIKENRSANAYGRRLAWTSLPGETFNLMRQWGKDNGAQLAARIANSPEGVDMAWMVAIGNPARDWSSTAEWVADLKVDEGERAAVIEQMAREGLDGGQGLEAVHVFAAHVDPVYDRAKAALVVDMIQADPYAAKLAWDSMNGRNSKLSAAIQVLSDPSVAPAAKKLVEQWADGADLSPPVGGAWSYMTPDQ